MQAAESLELRIVDKHVVKSLVEQHIVLAGKSSEHRSKGFLVFMPKVGVRSCSAKESDNSPGLEVLQNCSERRASDIWIGTSQHISSAELHNYRMGPVWDRSIQSGKTVCSCIMNNTGIENHDCFSLRPQCKFKLVRKAVANGDTATGGVRVPEHNDSGRL